MITIQEMHIYGFGKHIDQVISLQDGMNIIYGQNEAGKTTIQQFILQIFFGFPAKNSILAKYEPKMSARFGGSIRLVHPKYGQCQIERVKGKSGGDVTVRLADGTVGQDELLGKLLYGYSRAAFEAIFAFSLHELQGIERMTEEELSRVLLASGTTGVDQLTKVEKKLEKEMGELYKKSGKNPAINQKLELLKQTEREIQQYKQKISSYDTQLKRLKEIEQVLDTMQLKQHSLQERWRELSKIQQALPLLLEQQTLERELTTLKVKEFPVDGIRRFEQLKDRLQHFEAKITQLNNQKQELEDRLAQQLDIPRYSKLQQLLEKESEWHHQSATIRTIQQELELLLAEQDNQFRLLGIEQLLERQQVISQNVSLQEEERFQALLGQLELLEEKQKVQTHSIERIRDELDEIENRLKVMQQDRPTEEERQLLQEWPLKQQRLEQLKAQEQASNQSEAVSYKMSWILLILATATIFFGLWQRNWPVLIVGVVLLVVGVQFFRTAQATKQTKIQQSNLRQILHEIRELEQQAIVVATLKERAQRYDERYQTMQEQHQSKYMQYKYGEQTVAQLEVEYAKHWGEVEEFLSSFFINGVTQRKLLPELFTRVREIQRLAMLVSTKRQALSDLLMQQEQIINQATELTGKMCTIDSAYIYIRNAYQQLEEQKNEAVHLEKQLAEKLEQLYLEETERTLIEKNVQQLFEYVHVEDESAFYEAEKQYTLYSEKNGRYQFILEQIQTINPPTLNILPTMDYVKQELEDLAGIQSRNQNELEQLLSEKASLHFNTDALLTDEQYGILQQLFEQQKAELAEVAVKWSMQKAIVHSIEHVMRTLREEKLPKVLEQVNHIFNTLTGGRYTELVMNTQGNFEAVSVDGMRYHVAELSQATKEQAYVALRFALAQSLIETAPFPFIMDDPFVHFDRKRLGYMIQLMQEVKYERQILYFTCHPTSQDEYKDVHIIHLT